VLLSLQTTVMMLEATMTSPRAMTAKFAGTCSRCNLRFGAGTPILWSKGSGATHASDAACHDAAIKAADVVKPFVKPTVDVGEFSAVVALFDTAKAHLKFPKVALSVAGTTVKLALAGAKSKTPGYVTIAGEGSYPDRAWYGTVSPAGVYTPGSRVTPAFRDALVDVLKAFGANPAAVAKDHGKLLGACCFCYTPIGTGEDRRSVAVGFGPVCAKNWGLMDAWRTGETLPVAA
jgi:hypothetical protein